MNSILLKETNKKNTFFILKEKIKQKHKNIESQIETKKREREKERAMQAIIENRKLHYQLQTHQSMLIIQKKRSQT